MQSMALKLHFVSAKPSIMTMDDMRDEFVVSWNWEMEVGARGLSENLARSATFTTSVMVDSFDAGKELLFQTIERELHHLGYLQLTPCSWKQVIENPGQIHAPLSATNLHRHGHNVGWEGQPSDTDRWLQVTTPVGNATTSSLIPAMKSLAESRTFTGRLLTNCLSRTIRRLGPGIL